MARTPNIRFKGFSGEWEQRKLGEIADKVTEKNINNDISETFTNSAEFGIISQRDFFEHDISNSENLDGYYIVKNEDFVYNPRISVTAPVGPINRNKLGRNGVMSPLYTVFRTHDIDNAYLEWYFKSSHWHSFMTFNGDTGARSDRFSIKDALFFEMPIPTPTLAEQAQIGAFFSTLDTLITLHQRKCEEAKTLKKYMLQKMFPQNGEKAPEIRFKGFSGDWEQRKYSDIATTRRGLTYNPNDIVDGGKRVLRSSNINEDTFETHEDDVFVDEKAVNIPYVKNGDILITSANGSSRLVGKHAIVRDIPDNCVVHGGFMLLASSDEPEFVNALMSSQWYTKFVNIYVAGGNGAIGNLNKNDLDEQKVLVPSSNEQKKIGTFFSTLDHLITLHQRKCEELKEVKRYMLKNMFPA